MWTPVPHVRFSGVERVILPNQTQLVLDDHNVMFTLKTTIAFVSYAVSHNLFHSLCLFEESRTKCKI